MAFKMNTLSYIMVNKHFLPVMVLLGSYDGPSAIWKMRKMTGFLNFCPTEPPYLIYIVDIGVETFQNHE